MPKGVYVRRKKETGSFLCSSCLRIFSSQRGLSKHKNSCSKSQRKEVLENEFVNAESPKVGENESKKNVHIAYVFGKVETLIEGYADSANIPRSSLAIGVGKLLLRKTSRSLLGS